MNRRILAIGLLLCFTAWWLNPSRAQAAEERRMWTPMFTLIASFLPDCPTEDSDDCAWHAERQGNGGGTSFITIGGVTWWPQVQTRTIDGHVGCQVTVADTSHVTCPDGYTTTS
jgi:hypothetical protein